VKRQEIARLTEQLTVAGWELVASVRIQGQRYQLTFECGPVE
jgi:hypothetical protein